MIPILGLKLRSATNQWGPIGKTAFNLWLNDVQPNQQIKELIEGGQYKLTSLGLAIPTYETHDRAIITCNIMGIALVLTDFPSCLRAFRWLC
jgi:hypothetical protein